MQRAAARVCGSAVLACVLVVLSVWHAAQPRADRAQSAALPKAGLAQVLGAGSASAGAGRGGRGPVLSSLLETQLAETCDCSKPKKCEEIIKTELKQKLPGGGAGGLSQQDWGAWDPVSGVPRIGCPDTVTRAECTPRPARARRAVVHRFARPVVSRPFSYCSAPLMMILHHHHGCFCGRHTFQGRTNGVYIAREPLLWLDDVCADRQGSVKEGVHAISRATSALH